jgi:FkbM family methyltransferase
MNSNSLRPDIVSFALASIPPMRGKHWLVDALGRAKGRRAPSEGVCSPGNGAILRVDLNDRIQRLMWGHCYEIHVQRCIRALLSAGDAYLDVGAHIGYHSVLAAALVGSAGSVYAFEADPGNFRRLQENLYPFSWATAVNKAVWSTTGTMVFEQSPQRGESGWGTLSEVRDLNQGEHISVSAVSLDDWSAENRIERVTLMKIDAEGSEVGILQGARNFLNRFRPAIITEINDTLLRQGHQSSNKMVEILHECGYELFHLNGKHIQPLQLTGPSQFCEVLGLDAAQRESALQRLQRQGFDIDRHPARTGGAQHDC